jgi:hydroxypyruvate isomerase
MLHGELMLKFSANISTLFQELPLLYRIAAAADAGFKAVELWFPYEIPAAEFRDALNHHDLEIVAMNSAPGIIDRGDWGLAADPARRLEFIESAHQAVEYAHDVGCPGVHMMAGCVPPALGRERAWDVYQANINEACGIAARLSRTVMVEPLNAVDRPTYLLNRQQQAISLIETLKQPNLKILLDLFHVQRGEGNLIERMRLSLPHAGHVQIADVPGRHEPGTGEINFPEVYKAMREAGWNGWIGCEYLPLDTTKAGLGWMRQALLKLSSDTVCRA